MHYSSNTALALCLLHMPVIIHSFVMPANVEDALEKREPQVVTTASPMVTGGRCQPAVHSMACDESGANIVCDRPDVRVLTNVVRCNVEDILTQTLDELHGRL